MLYEIKSRSSGHIIAAEEAESLKVAVESLILRGALLSGALLRDAVLSGADLRGALLSGADLRGADLSGALLRDAVLRGADLSGAVLRDAVLRGAVLSDAVLRGAVLSGADLSDAVLSGADLRGALLRGALLRGADLNGALLRGAVLSGQEFYAVPDLHTKMLAAIQSGGLEMGLWHTCETTHCRGGWAVVLAGNCGKLLEAQMGTAAAAALIHLASCPWMEKIPNFYASNEDAMADIKACAERERQETTK